MDSTAEQPSLRLELGSMEDLPTIFHCLQEQFPPDEFYNYERMEQMMHHNQYKILLYNTKHRLLPSLTKGGGVLWEIISNKYMSVHIPDFALAKLSMCASTLEASHADKSAQRVMKD